MNISSRRAFTEIRHIKSCWRFYKNKYAYCETNTLAGATLQVEHYRPKAKLIEDTDHLGYYWLAYEWTN
jgi:hypothetical protein